MVSGSVTSENDVERAIKMATKPVHGVIQASMVLKVRYNELSQYLMHNLTLTLGYQPRIYVVR